MTPASTAAATLVGLMATEGWDEFKEVAAAPWTRVSLEQTVAANAELAQTRRAVPAARDVGEEQSQADIAGPRIRRGAPNGRRRSGCDA